MMRATEENMKDLLIENRTLKREIKNQQKRIEKMEVIFDNLHDEIRELRIKAGARAVGPNKAK